MGGDFEAERYDVAFARADPANNSRRIARYVNPPMRGIVRKHVPYDSEIMAEKISLTVKFLLLSIVACRYALSTMT